MKFRLTINRKMLLFILGVAALIYAGSLGYIGIRLSKVSTENATRTSNATATEYANIVRQELTSYEQSLEVLAGAFSNIYELPEASRRSYALEIMEQLLLSNPEHLSVWAVWEPYAIDQLDSLNVLAPGSTNNGSFSPSLYRKGSNILLDAIKDVNLLQKKGYAEIKDCECAMFLEPYYYSYSDDSILETDLAIPIMIDNEFKGVVGIDIPLSYFQDRFGKMRPLNDGQVYIVSNKGTIVSCPDTSFIGLPLSDIAPEANSRTNALESVANGETFNVYGYNVIFNEKSYSVFQPIALGNAVTPWSICVSIPKSTIYSESNKSLLNIVLIALFGLLNLSLAIWFISRSVSNPIMRVTKALQNLADGNIDEKGKVKIKIKDEIGDLAGSVNELFEGLNSAAKFAGEIGKGNLNTEYKLLGHYDDLGSSLLEMQNSLKIAKEEEDKKKVIDDQRNWVTHGLAQFGEVIRRNNDDMDKFSYNVVAELEKYMKVAQVGIFISEKDQYSDAEEEYVLKAAIAYGKPVMLEKRVKRGNELVGRAVDENRIINLTNLPNDFVELSPGLKSKKRPDNLLISPLTVNDITFGVFELLSYEPFQAHEIEFVEKLSENVASVISSVNTNIQTASLLEQSQHQADELAQHEEEMRQNLEEMQATQEEASKRETNLTSYIKTIQNSVMTAELDMTGRVLSMSKVMLATYGLSIDNIKGKYFNAFIAQSEELRESFSQFWDDLIRNGKGRRKYTIKQRNKVLIIFEEYIVVEDEGMMPKVLLVAIDRSEQVSLNEKLKKEIDSSR